jgi:hypothetical protein
MLYCPQCGTEYREGYSSCSDCHVLLVRERPKQGELHSVAGPGDPSKDPYTEFWRGEDARLHAELCSLLDEAEIPHITIQKEDRLFRFTTQPSLQLAVPFSQMEKAESVIREAFGETPELPAPGTQSEGEKKTEEIDDWKKFARDPSRKRFLPAILEKLRGPRPPAGETRRAQRKDPDEWFAEDATIEVWSGPDAAFAEMIAASLRENEILSRCDEFKSSHVVLVEPKDQVRAREIIRQIVEATPPE